MTNSKLALILDIIEYYLACIVSFVWSLAYILGIFFVLILLILERIKKAWEDLIKEKEKGYDKEKYKEYSSSYKEYKSKRYFKEFEKFDLENFEKNNPYEVLGVLKGATEKEITKAYKGLMAKYHPDRFAHEGELEKIKEAEKIARLINWGREGCLKI